MPYSLQGPVITGVFEDDDLAKGADTAARYNNVWELLEEAAGGSSGGDRDGRCHIVNGLMRADTSSSDGGLGLSYGGLRARARQLAAFLALRGAKPGDRVALVLRNSAAGA